MKLFALQPALHAKKRHILFVCDILESPSGTSRAGPENILIVRFLREN